MTLLDTPQEFDTVKVGNHPGRWYIDEIVDRPKPVANVRETTNGEVRLHVSLSELLVLERHPVLREAA